MNNTEHKKMKIKKTEDIKTYMREYMREYNKKRYGEHKQKTPEEKKASRRISHKKYYDKNRHKIQKKQAIKQLNRRIEICNERLKTLTLDECNERLKTLTHDHEKTE